jgi:hypothetical protein
MTPLPLQLPLLIFAGWVNRQQQEMIDYLQEENREQTAAGHVAEREVRAGPRAPESSGRSP